MRDISVSKLAAWLKESEGKPILLDVREPWEFNICHIEGSQLLPMHSIPSAIHQLDKTQETVVICHHGIRSRQVVIYLESQGFKNMINLGGGVSAWAYEIDHQMPTY